MSKKTEKDRARDDEDLDDEDLDGEDNDDGEEDEAKATAVHGRDDDDEDDGTEPEDPYWWAPHAVLSALVLIGLLGFFGMFNKTPLARIAAPVAPEPDDHAHAVAASPAPAPTPTPRPAQSARAPREMFGAKHLLVMHKGSRRAPPTIERTKEEAQARATEAMKKAKADPSKFTEIVKEYSDEPGADRRGGDLGKFPKGAMVPEFQAGLEKIKVGEVSDLVETPFGYHVILRTQ
ncbi:peptidylprolyl isomerase [Sorangium sp. So ce1335]|uniref:peptidylprolyl isomerase n=1 Tax=Sorangium sp. So ce1335 TaxID=3133335 RepID=UPI003F5F7BCE